MPDTASEVLTSSKNEKLTNEGPPKPTAVDSVPTEEVAHGETKKSVKFADDIDEFVLPTGDESEKNAKELRPIQSSLVSGSFSSNDRVIELDDDDDIVGITPVIPEDESPEDARLRREMLQYSLNEIGSVVAELELDETYSDDEDDDEIDFDDAASLNSEMSEDEDEHGRSIRKGVGSTYRQQMLELEEKLMARMLENVGPEPDENNPDIDPEDLRKLVIRRDDEMPSAKAPESIVSPPSKAKDSGAKKGVRFADALDYSDAPTVETRERGADVAKSKTAPIIDDVLERRAPAVHSEGKEQTKPGRVSRFKKDRSVVPPPATESADLEDQSSTMEQDNRPILSDAILERPARKTAAPTPDASEFDPEIQQRQLASEYYRMRNNMIRQQGGFKADEAELDDPLMEEVNGKVKKVSRFKAARLR